MRSGDIITTDRRFENREREVAEIAQQLRALALGLRVPVLVAAQLNRGPEQRADKRPLLVLADLRDCDANLPLLRTNSACGQTTPSNLGRYFPEQDRGPILVAGPRCTMSKFGSWAASMARGKPEH